MLDCNATNHLQKLTPLPLAYTNIKCGLAEQKGTKFVIQHMAYKVAWESTEDPSHDYDRIQKRALAFFEKNIKTFSDEYGDQLKTDCRAFDFHSDLHSMLLSFIEKGVARYLINNPEDTAFKQEYENFCLKCAGYRFFNKTPTFTKELREKFQSIRQKLLNINADIPKAQIQYEDRLWHFFEKVLNKDIALLDVPVACLAGISEYKDEPEIKTTVSCLLKANNEMVERLLKNLPWVLKHCEEKLKPFIEMPQENTMNSSKALFDMIQEFKEKLLPKIPLLYLESSTQASEERIKIIEELVKMQQSWYKPAYFFHIDEDTEKKTVTLNYYETRENQELNQPLPYSPSFFCSNEKLVYLKYAHDCLREISERINKGEQFSQEHLEVVEPLINSTNFNNLENAIAFNEALLEISPVVRTYISSPLIDFCLVAKTLNTWINTLTAEQREELNRHQLNKKSSDNKKEISVKAPQKKVPSTTRQAKTRQKSHQTRTTKTKQHRKKKRNTKSLSKQHPITNFPKLDKEKEKEETESYQRTKKTSEKEEVILPSSSLALPFPVLAFEALNRKLTSAIKTIHKKENLELKNHFRQAKMNLDDIMVAQTDYDKAKEHSSKLFYLVTMIQGSYFYLEQILHAQRTYHKGHAPRWGNGHNLELIKNEIHLKSHHPILTQLSLALYWTRSTYEQLRNRERWNTPSCLLAIKKFYEAKDLTDNKLSKKIKKVYQYVTALPQFSDSLPILQHVQGPSSEEKTALPPTPLLLQEREFFPEEMERLAARCKSLFNKVNPIFQPQFAQVISHLSVVKGILFELSKKEMTSDEFSLLIRGLLFWENTVLEELLQVLGSIKNGWHSQTHHLSHLYREAYGDEATNVQELTFLQELQDLHNLSRYPFENKPQKESSSEVHQLILQSELLRERPEIGLDFELPKGERHGTSLNYVKTRAAKPEQILIKLMEIHQKIYKIMETTISKIE